MGDKVSAILFKLDACALGSTCHLVACDLQQSAVHRVRDGLLLHRRVDYHPLQVLGLDRIDGHCRVDGGLEQQLQPLFAQVTAKASDLCRVTWQPVFVVGHAAEELPHDVLAPAHHEFFVAEVETVLEVQQAGHQANRQLGSSGVAATHAHQDLRGAEHVTALENLTGAILPLKLHCHRRFDLLPGQACGQHRQGIVQIDHGVDAATEKVQRLHPRIPQKVSLPTTLLGRFSAQGLHQKPRIDAGWRGFAGPTMY